MSELTRDSSIVTGWSLYTEILGFLDSYVTFRHFLKQVSAGNWPGRSFVLVTKLHRGKNVLEVHPKLLHAVFSDVAGVGIRMLEMVFCGIELSLLGILMIRLFVKWSSTFLFYFKPAYRLKVCSLTFISFLSFQDTFTFVGYKQHKVSVKQERMSVP